MGIRDWFAKKPPILGSVSSPTEEYPTPLNAIETLIAANEQAGDDSAWVTFEADADGPKAIVEISGDQLNFCKREVALCELLKSSAAAPLAHRATPGGRKQTDRTCWTLADPTPHDLALIVHAVFQHEFRLGEEYLLSGKRNY